MTRSPQILVFGVRSPMVADFEETCERAGLTIAAAVKACGHGPRLLDRRPLIEPAALTSALREIRCVVCAFSPIRRRELVAAALAAGLHFDGPAGRPDDGDRGFDAPGRRHVRRRRRRRSARPGRLGDHVFVNRAVNLGHHAVFDDFATIGPGVTIAGHVRIGEATVIGAGSTILPGVVIGARAMVAAGSLVRRDVADDTLVAGAPARPTRLSPAKTAVHPPGEE